MEDKSDSDIIVEVACRETKAELLDCKIFVVDEEIFHQFLTQLNIPQQNEKLRRLLQIKAPWE
ncbi:hypothetical protein C7B80_13405 [Cyanosarcina cf. burmensis CCALA 770]|nr:hypothetical protein C7B80_13405 [Cyanosarcina cf. burmensis CCALA 770]